MRSVAITMLVCALSSVAVLAEEPAQTPVTGEPDATVEFSGGKVAAGIGFSWGQGHITYRGQQHNFKASGRGLDARGLGGNASTAESGAIRRAQPAGSRRQVPKSFEGRRG